MMIKIAICDDLKQDRDELLKLIEESNILNKFDEVDFRVSIFTCGKDLENHYAEENYHFDIIFLDIYMLSQTGIETAYEIRKYDTLCKIIFTTTSVDHALESYGVFAYNYLVKPIYLKTFQPIFEKAINDSNIEKQKTLSIKAGSKIQSILYKNIKYIESDGKIIKIFTRENNIITSYCKLDEIESNLSDTRFLRSHKSFLINMDYIKGVEKYHFTLKDHTIVPIRQRGFSEIKKTYYSFILENTD